MAWATIADHASPRGLSPGGASTPPDPRGEFKMLYLPMGMALAMAMAVAMAMAMAVAVAVAMAMAIAMAIADHASLRIALPWGLAHPRTPPSSDLNISCLIA